MSKTGTLFVVSAPSGTGKTTLCQWLLGQSDRLGYSVSHTTRQPRDGEVDGKDYYFVSKEVFRSLIDQDKLLEWAEVHGNYYGTSLMAVQDVLSQGKDILLDIDVNGAREVVRCYPDAVTIFIMPPSLEVLRTRLEKRGTDDAQTIELRIENAKYELTHKGEYRHVLVNEDLEIAKTELAAIINRYRTQL